MIGKDKWVEQFLVQEESTFEAEISGGFNKPKASDKYKYGEKDPKNFGAEAAAKAEKATGDTEGATGAVRVGKPFNDANGVENVIFKVSKNVGKAGKKTITVHVPAVLDGKKLSAKAIKELAVAIASNKIDGMMKKLTANAIQEAEVAIIVEAKKKAAEQPMDDLGDDAGGDEPAAEEKPKKKKKKEETADSEGGDVDPEDLDLDSLDADTKVDLIERIMSSLQDNCEEKEYQKCFDKVSDMMDSFMPEESGDEEPPADDEEEV